MSTPYDESFKTLIRDDPLAFIHLMFPGAQLVRQLREKLKEWKLEVDALFEITLESGIPILVHYEFQTYNDPEMAKRLLRYNVLIWSEYNLPVCSCVIHVLGDGHLPTSPFQLEIDPTRPIFRFHFDVLELGELSPEELMQTGQPNLFPLLPFTRGGASREVVETVFEELVQSGKTNLLSVAQTLASLAFGRAKNDTDQEWLLRRYRQMFDIIKDTPVYREMVRDAREEGWEEGLKEGREEGLKEGREEGLKEGLEKGLEKGIEEGRKQGQVEALEQTLIDLIADRFPRLVRFARRQLSDVDDPALLRLLVLKLSTAQTAEEVREQLLTIIEEADEEQGEQ